MPEASVRRRVQALSGFIGRKVFRRRLRTFLIKARGLTAERLEIRREWSNFGSAGTDGVAVKCVDIVWNTKGEGRHLGIH